MNGPMYIEKNLSFDRYRIYCKQLLKDRITSIKKRRTPLCRSEDYSKKISELKNRAHRFVSTCMFDYYNST